MFLYRTWTTRAPTAAATVIISIFFRTSSQLTSPQSNCMQVDRMQVAGMSELLIILQLTENTSTSAGNIGNLPNLSWKLPMTVETKFRKETAVAIA